jgi:hypothetical protein
MLLIHTEIRPSAIHCIGLFACEFIAAGSLVWRFDPRVDNLSLEQFGKVANRTWLRRSLLWRAPPSVHLGRRPGLPAARAIGAFDLTHD